MADNEINNEIMCRLFVINIHLSVCGFGAEKLQERRVGVCDTPYLLFTVSL